MASIKAPAIGAPIVAATPWNKSRRPNAFVRRSRPNKSTTMIDRSDAKQAVTIRNPELEKFGKLLTSYGFEGCQNFILANPQTILNQSTDLDPGG